MSSAAARGAAGYLFASGRLNRRREDRTLTKARAEAEQHLKRFLSPERARELAAEAIKVSYKRRKRISTAPEGA